MRMSSWRLGDRLGVTAGLGRCLWAGKRLWVPKGLTYRPAAQNLGSLTVSSQGACAKDLSIQERPSGEGRMDQAGS